MMINNRNLKPKKRRLNCKRRIKKKQYIRGISNTLSFSIILVLIPILIHASVYSNIKKEGIKGRIYISDYYSTDSGDYDFHILTSRLNVYKREEEKSNYFFEFDGKVRKKFLRGDQREDYPEYKVDDAWLGYKFFDRKLKVIAGRQYIHELYNTNIDGLNAKYSIKKGMGIGIFGGFAPHKYDNSFNSKFKSIGIYGFFDQKDHKISAGYENLIFDGKTDREYFSLRVYSKFNKKTRLNALSSASINQITGDFEVENANINLLHSYSKKLRFNTFFNYYRTIKYYESSKYYMEFSDIDDSYLLNTNSQTRAGMRVDYKILKGLKVYVSTAYQHRKFDDEDALRVTGGIRKYDLWGFDVSGRYTYIDNFTSKSNEFNVEIYRNIMNKFDVSVYASHEEEKIDIENAYTSGALTYGGTLYWPIDKHFFYSMFIEHIDEDDYSNTSVFGQVGFKF